MLTLCGGIGTFALCYEKAGGRIKLEQKTKIESKKKIFYTMRMR